VNFFRKKWSQIPLRCGEMFVASGSWFYRDSQEWPLEEVVEQYTNLYLRGSNLPLMIDIEHLDYLTPDGLRHIERAFELYRDRNPGLRIGLYGLPEYGWEAVNRRKDSPEKMAAFRAWLNRQASLRLGWDSVRRLCDFISPHLYAPYGDFAQWKAATDYALQQAVAFGNPAIPCVWHRFEHLPGQPYVGDDFLRSMLIHLRDHKTKPEGYLLWDQGVNDWPASAVQIASDVLRLAVEPVSPVNDEEGA
jgi:hypothetical protein